MSSKVFKDLSATTIVYLFAYMMSFAGRSRPMQRTIYDSKFLFGATHRLASIILKLAGWKAVDRSGGLKRYFLIVAPHTSNWDLVLMEFMAHALWIRGYWMGKHTIFKGPLGVFFKFLGGLPVDRTKSQNMVERGIHYYGEKEEFVFANAPEGTRKKVDRWRSGFSHIAMGAKVPIALAFLDYRKKEGGIGGMFYPTGDYNKDLKEIMEFYSHITPKNPRKENK